MDELISQPSTEGGGIWWEHGRVWVGEPTEFGSNWKNFDIPPCFLCHRALKEQPPVKDTPQLHTSKYYPKYRMRLRNGQEINFGKAFIKYEKYRLHVLDKNHKLYKTLPSGTYVLRTPKGGMGMIFPANARGIDEKGLVSAFKGVVK
jgi:hypothetical protein